MKVTNYATSKSGAKYSVIAVACERCNHIMVVKSGRSITAFKSLAAIAREQISACPACGADVPIREKMSVFGSLTAHKNAAEELTLKLQEVHEEDLHKELAALIDKVKKPEDQPADNATAQSIRGDISRIKQYLDAMIKLETDSRLLITRIVALSRQKREELSKAADAQLDALAKSRKESKAAETKVQKLRDEIQQLETEFETKDWEKAVKVRKVPAPKAPEYLEVPVLLEPRYPKLKEPNAEGIYPGEPAYPKLKTPGLFNKKRVMEENAQLIARYEAAVAEYRLTCKRENLKLITQYEQAIEEYHHKCAQAEEIRRKNEEMKAEYDLKVQKHKASAAQRQEKALVEARQQKEEARVQLAQRVNELKTQIEQMVDDDNAPRIQLQIGHLFDVQIEVAKQQLKAVTQEKNRLYSVNVLYPTYRELVAESSFYEYFSSGRCDTLEGSHGAYNLFETECRSDVAARMIRTLEEVKQGQVILYRQMLQIRELLQDVEAALEKAIPHIRRVSQDRMSAYLEENCKMGKAAAESGKQDSKETAVAKYFRLVAACEARVDDTIAQAKQMAL